MIRLLSMTSSLALTIDNNPTDITLDSHATRIRKIVLRLQFPAQFLGGDENVDIVRVPDPLVKLRGVISFRMRRIGGTLDNSVIVNP